MANNRKKDILGVLVDDITMESAVCEILASKDKGGRVSVFTPNSEMVMEARRDREFMDILNSGSIVVPDGAGVVLGSRILGKRITEKVAGVELVENILSSGKSLSLYIFGSKPGVAEKAAKNIETRFSSIDICGMDHGYHAAGENDGILQKILAAKPDLLLVGLGVPRQEKWISENIKAFGPVVCIGCGGTIDVFSGEVKRAPDFFIRMNLEWFYRLLKQPSRLKRMLRIPVFLIICVWNRIFRGSKGSS